MAKQVLVSVPAQVADEVVSRYEGAKLVQSELFDGMIHIPYEDEPGVLKTTKAKWESLVRDIGFAAAEYLCQQLAMYSETHPNKFKKYKDHALVLRKWHEMKAADGYVYSPKHGHYVKRWVAREDGVL